MGIHRMVVSRPGSLASQSTQIRAEHGVRLPAAQQGVVVDPAGSSLAQLFSGRHHAEMLDSAPLHGNAVIGGPAPDSPAAIARPQGRILIIIFLQRPDCWAV